MTHEAADKKETRLVLVDDHQIVIDGLKLLLSGQPHIRIVGEATSAKDSLPLLKNSCADILVTDIMMPGMGGYELALHVRTEGYPIKILALSMSEDGAMIAGMIDHAKVDAYIPKASGRQELLKAIEHILEGATYFSPSIRDQYQAYKKIKQQNEALQLTSRELEIIECMIRHLSNRDIGRKLFISERTVETHRKNIFRKTDTKGIPALIQFVQEHKILS